MELKLSQTPMTIKTGQLYKLELYGNGKCVIIELNFKKWIHWTEKLKSRHKRHSGYKTIHLKDDLDYRTKSKWDENLEVKNEVANICLVEPLKKKI